MIYVKVQAIKSEGRLGIAGGWRWHETDDVAQAVSEALQEFGDFWAGQGHGAIITYEITVVAGMFCPSDDGRVTTHWRALPGQ